MYLALTKTSKYYGYEATQCESCESLKRYCCVAYKVFVMVLEVVWHNSGVVL